MHPLFDLSDYLAGQLFRVQIRLNVPLGPSNTDRCFPFRPDPFIGAMQSRVLISVSLFRAYEPGFPRRPTVFLGPTLFFVCVGLNRPDVKKVIRVGRPEIMMPNFLNGLDFAHTPGFVVCRLIFAHF